MSDIYGMAVGAHQSDCTNPGLGPGTTEFSVLALNLVCADGNSSGTS